MEPVLVSALEHWSYCPRQCGLIHVDQVWDENVFTLRGNAVHERADQPISRTERGVRVERALPIWSDRYGLLGKADLVEFTNDGRPVPVEYKSGPARYDPHSALQLCAQALCLEEMFGRDVPEGAVFFAASQKRKPVKIDDALRTRTLQAIEDLREMLSSGHIPPPCNDSRCRNCSLVEACMPNAIDVSATLHREATKPLPEKELP